MGKPVKNYVLLVDSHKKPEQKRNTAGRYRVGAKSPDEAVKLLRETIGFGSIHVYYEVIPGVHGREDHMVGYKTVVQEVFDPSLPGFRHVRPHHATQSFLASLNEE